MIAAIYARKSTDQSALRTEALPLTHEFDRRAYLPRRVATEADGVQPLHQQLGLAPAQGERAKHRHAWRFGRNDGRGPQPLPNLGREGQVRREWLELNN